MVCSDVADVLDARRKSGSDLRQSDERRERVSGVLAKVAASLGERSQFDPERIVDDGLALEALADAWQATAAAAPHDEAGFTTLVDLLVEIRACEDDVRDARARQSAASMEGVRRALDSLRNTRTVAELIHRAPEAAAQLGFDRVLLSRIQDSVWVPESIVADCDPRWVGRFLEMGRKHPPALDGSLVETQIVRQRKAWLVADVTDRSDLHWRLVSVSRSRSYVAAPIVVGDDVVALLHADRFQQWRSVDVRDRDMLWLFCEGLSNLCSRAAITEHLASLRDELDRLFANLSPDSGDVWASSTARVSVSSTQPDDSSHLIRKRTVGRALTRRELEVLRLVSEGLTNAQIARRLFIGEGTVKSHVKAILRKLHASHRAEAVSMWLRETNRAQGKAG